MNIFCALLSILIIPKFESVGFFSVLAEADAIGGLAAITFDFMSLLVEKYGMNVLQTHRLYAACNENDNKNYNISYFLSTNCHIMLRVE